MNIATIIQAALTALKSSAEVLLLEQSRAENEELNHTKDIIIVYPDWRTNNVLSQGAELLKQRDYNITFKSKDEWDNSDDSTPNYDDSTSIDRVETMNQLAYSVLSSIILNKELIEFTQNPEWRLKPRLRSGNGTMTGVDVRLRTYFTSDILCPTVSIPENDTTNIKSIIESILIALDSDAKVYTLEQARAANQELNFDTSVIIIYPDWDVINNFSPAGEIFQRYLYNIDFKTQDEWDNSDNQDDNAYNGITSIEKVEAMETLSDSIFSYMTVKRDLFPQLKSDPSWSYSKPILRQGNGTMSGISVRLEVAMYGDRVCNYLGFSPEFQSVYDVWTIKPEPEIASNMDAMVRGWVNSGVWDKSDRIFVFAIHTNDNGEALIDWKNPTGTPATMINNPTFTPFEGFTGDGATKYIDSNYNPEIHGVNYTANDAGISVYNRTNLARSAFVGVISTDSLKWVYLFPYRITLDKPILRFNGTTITVGNDVTSTLGMWTLNRLSASSVNTYFNSNIILQSNNNTSNGVPDKPIEILRAVGFNYDGQLSMCRIGSSLTQQEAIDNMNYFEYYMDSNGKGVI